MIFWTRKKQISLSKLARRVIVKKRKGKIGKRVKKGNEEKKEESSGTVWTLMEVPTSHLKATKLR